MEAGNRQRKTPPGDPGGLRGSERVDVERMRDYLKAAMDANGCENLCQLETRVGCSHGRLYQCWRNEHRATIGMLLNVEEMTGVSLDWLDPRIHRVMDRLPTLWQEIEARGWVRYRMNRAVGISSEAITKMCNTGKVMPHLSVDALVKLCDLLEGRIEYVLPTQPAKGAKLCKQWGPGEKTGRQAPAVPMLQCVEPGRKPEAREDPFYAEALDVFRRMIHPRPERFHLRAVAPGRVEGYGTELKWRVERHGDRAMILAIWRKSGRVCGRWIA